MGYVLAPCKIFLMVGARVYLFTVTTTEGPVSWFYSNTGNADTFLHPATVDEGFFQTQGLPLDNQSPTLPLRRLLVV
jgi:hypothetical protein